ncbi:MAG: hypothetical protein FWC28_06035 [Proteobacteria bacterium]|nr:hypothetical protein [Cystobacterineae bacterium]MCL2258815.1 hypothetical protein [Cystobacterineae bacterium]MCL2314792.1 hypothetical protein [Pseudomonadota bacterium]
MFSKRLLKCWLLGACLAVFAQAAPPKAKEVLEPYKDMEALRSQLSSYALYTDGNGHYLAFSETELTNSPVFWGKAGVFFAQSVFGGGGTLKTKEKDVPRAYLKFHTYFWEPRSTKHHNTLVKKEDGVLYISCGDKRKTALSPVPAEEARAILEKAQFYYRRFMRKPHLLVRDDTGVYYYVDKSTKEDEKDFQFFVGKRLHLKKTKLQNILQDTEGEIFATPNGTLRIVIGKNEIYWVRGKKKQALINVPVEQNLPFVWNDLGMYANQKMDTPCDDI